MTCTLLGSVRLLHTGIAAEGMNSVRRKIVVMVIRKVGVKDKMNGDKSVTGP